MRSVVARRQTGIVNIERFKPTRVIINIFNCGTPGHEMDRYDVTRLTDFMSVCMIMLTYFMLENGSQRICQNMKLTR